MKLPKEISEEEIKKEIEKRKMDWKTDESRDGFIQTWRKQFIFLGIPYELAILKYFTFDKGMYAGINKIGKHIVLEHPKELNEIASALKEDEYSEEFLFDDTIHSFQTDWKLAVMIEYEHKHARTQIKKLYEKIKTDNGLKEKLIKFLGEEKWKEVKRELVVEGL